MSQGDGSLLVFDTWDQFENGPIRDPALSRLVRAPRPTARRIKRGADTYRVLAVDAGRIVVLRSDGLLVLLDARGERLSAFRLGSGATAARLTGSHLIVQRGATLEVRNAATGAVEHRWPTAPSDAAITLEDADGEFAVYTAGIAIHVLRLTNGHDRVVRIPGEAQPAHAELEPSGLYYSYNETGSAKPGRLAFVPVAELSAHLR